MRDYWRKHGSEVCRLHGWRPNSVLDPLGPSAINNQLRTEADKGNPTV